MKTDNQKLQQIERILQIAKNTNTVSEAVLQDIQAVIDGTFKYWSKGIISDSNISDLKIGDQVKIIDGGNWDRFSKNRFVGRIGKIINFNCGITVYTNVGTVCVSKEDVRKIL